MSEQTRKHLFESVGAGLEGCRGPIRGHPADLVRGHLRAIREPQWGSDYEDALAEGAILICALVQASGKIDMWTEVALALSIRGLLS